MYFTILSASDIHCYRSIYKLTCFQCGYCPGCRWSITSTVARQHWASVRGSRSKHIQSGSGVHRARLVVHSWEGTGLGITGELVASDVTIPVSW